MSKSRRRSVPIFLFGAGGHGRVVFDIVQRQRRYEVTVVLDDRAVGQTLWGVPVSMGQAGFPELARRGPRLGVVALGDNHDRERVAGAAAAAGLGFVTVVDRSAQIGGDVELGPGTVIMPGVVVNAGSRVGTHVILNTSCSVDHDCRIGSFVHLSPGVRVGGQCTIGQRSHIGIGASIVAGIRIGSGVVVGAGAAVVADIPDDVLAVGVPARPVRQATA